MAITNQSANIEDIIESIRLRLVEGLPLADAYVQPVASDDYNPYYAGEKYVAIRPLGPEPFPKAGGQRRIRPEKRIIRVYLHIRNSSDVVGSDITALNLIMEFERQVNNLLDGWFPRDVDDTVNLTITALRPIPSVEQPPLRKAKADKGELQQVLHYQLSYLRPNTTPAPVITPSP